MTENTLFQAGTMGNTLVTSAAYRAAEKGEITLNAPVNDYLKAWKAPDFPGGRPLTVLDLLQNKSGLTYHKYYGYDSSAPVPTLLQVLNGEKPATTPATKILTAPGTTYNLAAENYVVLQQVAEDLSERSFDAVMHPLVFDPLGMKRSTFAQPLPESRRGEAAVGHDDEGKPLPGGWRVYPEAAASGLWTTPREFAVYLADFLRSIAGRNDAKILTSTSAKEMLKPVATDPDGDAQCSGVGIDRYKGRNHLFRGGNTQGYYTLFNARPETGSGILILTNRNLCWQFANELRDGLAKQENWPGF
jgi:CubicO group peptidase (beta-lactamase class C family)